jgi:hypothetical protein
MTEVGAMVVLYVIPSTMELICGPGGTLNVAVTDFTVSIVTKQVPVPEQTPDQPAKVDPLLGVAVSVTWVPLVKLAEQVAPQLTPAGFDVTVPVPVPVFDTERV